MLPDTNDSPPEGLQVSCGLSVALLIAPELRGPPRLVVAGVCRMVGADVPEATVHEDRDLRAREQQIGPASRHTWEWAVHAEAAAAGVQDLAQRELRGSVPGPLTAHS